MGSLTEALYGKTTKGRATHINGGASAGGSTIEGFEEAINFLKDLNPKYNRKVLISSIKKGAKPFVKAIKNETPQAERAVIEWFGKKRIIGTIVSKQKNQNYVSVLVGPKLKRPKRGKVTIADMQNKNDPWFRHFVIRGTAGYTIKKGKNAGRFIPGQQPNPFVDRAFNSTSSSE